MEPNVNNIDGASVADIHKEISVVQGSPFAWQDVSSSTQKGPVMPKLITALLGGYTETNMTNVFQYDEITDTAQLPSGKRYDQKGKDLPKDDAKQKYFGIPSFGLRFNVMPKDYEGRFIPGSNPREIMNEAYVMAQMTKKADRAWMLHDELGYAQLLTADTNLVSGGPFTTYNFYTDIIGGSRSTTSMELDNSSADHIALLRNEKKELQNTLGAYGESANAFVVICGDTFFEQRLDIERNESLGRPLKGSIDLASMEVDTSDWGSSTFSYDWFRGGQDNLVYINYGAEIVAGTKLVAETAAYMIPVGVSNFMGIAYAPAQTRSFVNTEAQKRYSWAKEDEWQGVSIFMEENKLFFNKMPDLVRALTNT